MMSYVPLHLHSHYSLLDGLAKIPELVFRVKELGLPACALTDHGALYGAIEFSKACREAGIKPIIGLETYVARRSLHDREPRVDSDPWHLVLLAENLEGYHNLIRLASLAHLEGFYYRPRIDKETLARHARGLIGLSACLASEVAEAARGGNLRAAAQVVGSYQAIFGRPNFFLELQDHPNLPEQVELNRLLVRLSKQTAAPLVATPDTHYLFPQDREAHEVLLAIQTGKALSDPHRLSMRHDDFSLIEPKRMGEAFRSIPEALTNTLTIAERCNLEIPMGTFILPAFPLPEGMTAEAQLRRLCKEGLPRRFGERPGPEVERRLEYELETICDAGFAAYFLIVADLVRWAREQGIVVGPGRGSAAGSIVSYLLGITDVNPLRYHLLFERFLSREGRRVAPPDIDLDFEKKRRGEVLAYLSRTYGSDRVAQIITFGTMEARAAVRDVGRALELPYSEVDEIAKLIPFGFSLSEAIERVSELRSRSEADPQVRRLLDFAARLEGVVRHASTHAAGVVITPEPLINHVPLQRGSGADEETIITQYSMYDLEALGLLKLDVLGLANLSIIDEVCRMVQQSHGVELATRTIPFDDQKTYELLSRGETHGVFQLESEGMRRYLRELRPTNFEDIVAMIALYRPGPMEWIPEYIAAKHGRAKPSYLHPALEPILAPTYGTPVYQEQIMQIARDLAGFSFADADVLRKAIGKKNRRLLLAQREKFVSGCLKRGIEHTLAERIFDFFEPFARYSFNRAHATAYAHVTYWTAYLKANYPIEFMAALLTSEQENFDKLAAAIGECRRMAINLLVPDINESEVDFTPCSERSIRFGLGAIKNVGRHAAGSIVEERKRGGAYRSLADFVARLSHQTLNRKVIESLAKVGALDQLAERTRILAGLDLIIAQLAHASKGAAPRQLGLFSQASPAALAKDLPLPEVPAADRRQRLTWERELLSAYVSDHPAREIAADLGALGLPPLASLSLERSGRRLRVAGLLTHVRKVVAKTGPMAFGRLEDGSGVCEVIAFPRLYAKTALLWQEDAALVITGRVEHEEGGTVRLLAEDVLELARALKLGETPLAGPTLAELRLYFPPQAGRKELEEVRKLVHSRPGTVPVSLYFTENGRWRKVPTTAHVDISPEFLENLRRIVGKEGVEVRM